MNLGRRQVAQLGAALAAGSAWPRLMAQSDYPSRPVRFVIPFAAGGGSDIVGRAICAKLQEALGATFVPENRGGGNSIIGLDVCAKARPDGYTLSLLTSSATVNVTLQGTKMPYDLQKDFAPITQITSQPYALVINPKLPVKDMADLLALAKARPGALNYGTSGTGGISQLAGALLSSMAKVRMTAVPYKGGNPALIDVVSGQIDMMFSSQLQAHPFVSSGRVRMIAVSSLRRSVAAPDVPTIAESGLPGYDVTGWYGLAAPAGTPSGIVDKLQQVIAKILKSPDMNEKLALDGSEAVGSTPAQFGEHIRSEVEKWRVLIRDTGITNG
jgi:tripartite-type tricarboxylate transporter receptor subunit TctC